MNYEEASKAREDLVSKAGNPAFAYTVLYVKDVDKSMNFYTKAFGFKPRRLDANHKWGELETGATTLAFTPLRQREAILTGGIHVASEEEKRPNIEISFNFDDLDAAFEGAVKHGAHVVAEPEDKSWGQKVGYLRDMDGVVIRLGSRVHPPSS